MGEVTLSFCLTSDDEEAINNLYATLAPLDNTNDVGRANSESKNRFGVRLFEHELAIERLSRDVFGVSGVFVSGGFMEQYSTLIVKMSELNFEYALFETFEDGGFSSKKTGFIFGKKTNYKTVMKKLADKNIDVALSIAVGQGKLKNTKELLGKGANPNVLVNGHSALIDLNGWGRVSLLKEFIEKGAKVNFLYDQNANGKFEPWLHIIPNQTDISLLSIKHGADIHALDYMGRNLLHQVSYYNNTKLAKAIINLGINTEIADKNGNTALDIATKHRSPGIVELIQKANKKQHRTP